MGRGINFPLFIFFNFFSKKFWWFKKLFYICIIIKNKTNRNYEQFKNISKD